MYIFCIVSSIYIGWLFSFFPTIMREECNRESLVDFLERIEEEDKREKEEVEKIEKEFELLNNEVELEVNKKLV